MRISLVARSIGRPALDLLQRRPFAVRVLAVFERACDLVAPDGEVVALVSPEVGDGPLNVVLGRLSPGGFLDEALALEPGVPGAVSGGRLQVGALEVGLEGALVWEPRPDWQTLWAAVGGRPALAPSPRRASPGSPLPLSRGAGEGEGGRGGGGEGLSATLASAFTEAGAALRAGWEGDIGRLEEGAARLAGLGGGLTPAGDDFLCGLMLRAWLAHPEPAAFCRTVVEAAAPRTTTLSAAFLRAAGRGECSAAWQRLLAALAAGEEDEITAATRQVLSFGATSGADALAGLLWACIQ